MFFLNKINNFHFSIIYLNFVLLLFLCSQQDQKKYGNVEETIRELEYQKAKVILDYHEQRYRSLLEVKGLLPSKELYLEKMHYEIAELDFQIMKLKNQLP